MKYQLHWRCGKNFSHKILDNNTELCYTNYAQQNQIFRIAVFLFGIIIPFFSHNYFCILVKVQIPQMVMAIYRNSIWFC